jgi:hypothetical protein
MSLGPMRYQGQLWDAPAFDDAVEEDLAGHTCTMCQDIIDTDENACLTPVGQYFHLECWLRPIMGSVLHLEGRCTCNGGATEEEEYPADESYRESARRSLQWLIDNNRGRFAA